MNNHAMITLDRLRFSYNGANSIVLKGLSLDIPPGAITAILGPNGVGKTTLLHVILGLLAPQAGEVRLDGRSQADYSRAELSRLVGLVLQSEYIPFNFTVLEYVLLGRTPYLGILESPGPEDFRAALEAIDNPGAVTVKASPDFRVERR